MLQWQIGAVRISQIVESKGASPPSFFFAGVEPADVQRHAWLRPHFAHRDGRLFASVHAFVIESEGCRIVVDTCVGNDKPRAVAMWNQLHELFLDKMTAAGFAPASTASPLTAPDRMSLRRDGGLDRLIGPGSRAADHSDRSQRRSGSPRSP